MSLSEKARRQMIGHYPNWVKKFDVSDYLSNQPMIEKLHEEKQMALALTVDLEENNKTLSFQVHELELSNQKLSTLLEENKKQSLIVVTLSLLATILVGIGVNLATSNPQAWIGWLLIVVSSVIELLIFVTTTRS